MDAAVEITGHNVAAADRYRSYVTAKLAELEQLNRGVIRYDVELNHEPNPRQAKSAQRVVITSHGRGPSVRAEAHGAELSAVLDEAIGKLEGQLRRQHDRRVDHRTRGERTTPDPDPT